MSVIAVNRLSPEAVTLCPRGGLVLGQDSRFVTVVNGLDGGELKVSFSLSLCPFFSSDTDDNGDTFRLEAAFLRERRAWLTEFTRVTAGEVHR